MVIVLCNSAANWKLDITLYFYLKSRFIWQLAAVKFQPLRNYNIEFLKFAILAWVVFPMFIFEHFLQHDWIILKRDVNKSTCNYLKARVNSSSSSSELALPLHVFCQKIIAEPSIDSLATTHLLYNIEARLIIHTIVLSWLISYVMLHNMAQSTLMTFDLA